MVRRVTPAQLQALVRQQQQKQRQAIDRYNAAARKYNQDVKRAVDNYNRVVRDHNARVRADRQRLENELQRLSQQKTTVTVRRTATVTSAYKVTESYRRLETRAEAGLSSSYNRMLDLSEREAANSVAVANRLAEDAGGAEDEGLDEVDEEVRAQLRQVSPDLEGRWTGAIFSLSPRNPDAARHFCTSAREIFTKILDSSAPDADVLASVASVELTEQGTPTRRTKLRYLLRRGKLDDSALEDFAEADMEDILQLFRVFNDGTHGSAGTFSLSQLNAIRRRVEHGIAYLVEIATA